MNSAKELAEMVDEANAEILRAATELQEKLRTYGLSGRLVTIVHVEIPDHPLKGTSGGEAKRENVLNFLSYR